MDFQDHLFIGSPGFGFRYGNSFAYNTSSMSSENLRPINNRKKSTKNTFYAGYSSASGRFDANAEDQPAGVALGTPRGHHLTGLVNLYSWRIDLLRTLVGRQFGEYFGYALAVADLDGDGRDDVIVGAPLYSDPDVARRSGHYEVGRVFVFYQGADVSVCDRYTYIPCLQNLS